MTKAEAVYKDNELKEYLKKIALQNNLEISLAEDVVDNFVQFIPEDMVKGMIFLGDESLSYKPENFKVDLKGAIFAGLEFLASINKPESIFQYLQLLIVSVCFVENCIKVKLNNEEAYIVYFLHKEDAYSLSMEEELFIARLQEWYQEMQMCELPRKNIEDALNNLYQMKVVEIENGKIILKEQVRGNIG